MDEEQKKHIAQLLGQLKDADAGVRMQAVEALGKLKVSHPKIVETLQLVNENEPDVFVRQAIQNALQNPAHASYVKPANAHSPLPSASTSLATMTTEQLLQEQILMLQEVNGNLIKLQAALQQQADYPAPVIVKDFEMSVSAMIGFALKWLVASIPVGIIVGLFLFFLSACTGGLLFR